MVAASVVGVWVNRTVWNQDRYLKLVTPLAEDRRSPNALAARSPTRSSRRSTSDRGSRRVSGELPQGAGQAQFLAGPITAAMHDFVLGQVKSFLRSDDVLEPVGAAQYARLHGKIVALLQGDYSELPNLSISGGAVQLNLLPVVVQIIQQVVPSLGINVTLPQIRPASNAIGRRRSSLVSSHLGGQLPADFGQLTIMIAGPAASLPAGGAEPAPARLRPRDRSR